MNKETIRKVVIDQREELERKFLKLKLVKRDSFEIYERYLKSSQIKVIAGIRRCGKSTLAQQLVQGKKFVYINFDDEKLLDLSAQDLNEVLEVSYELYGNFEYVLLDEIQNIKGWELFVNRLQRQGFNVIVTGSNSNLLSKELSTHLTGRNIKLELFPFSFKEFLAFYGIEVNPNRISTKETGMIKSKLKGYIESGGFPDVLFDPLNRTKYLQGLYSDIITKDIVIRHKIKLVKTLKNVANFLVSNVSSQISFNKIKNIYNIKSAHTVLNYVHFLEEAYLVFLLPRFSFKQKERDIANRKVYGIDSGLINALTINFSENLGRIYENIVFLGLLRKNSLESLFYWQDIYQNECDFVLKKDNHVEELIQICYDLTNYDTKKREIEGILKAGKYLKCDKFTIITSDYESEEIHNKKKITFIPLWKWLIKV
jgi:hypothetical protein